MKKYWIVLSLAGVMVAPAVFASYDGTIKLSQNSYSYGNGGQFTAQTSGLGTFQTFCIEYTEEFNPGSQYDYNMNSGAVAGGSGVDATDPRTGLSMDNISFGTAWLYSQFRAGTLPSYFSGTVSVQKQNAGDLQVAIWYLEGEVGSLVFNGADGSAFYNDAVAAATAAGKNVTDDSDGAYGVIALNLFNGPYATQVTINGVTYNLNQDQLAIVPEPATVIAGALLLLPLGASTLRILRRNRTA